LKIAIDNFRKEIDLRTKCVHKKGLCYTDLKGCQETLALSVSSANKDKLKLKDLLTMQQETKRRRIVFGLGMLSGGLVAGFITGLIFGFLK
jgi:hypothetical protein